MLKCLKLHQFLDGVARHFPTDKHAKLHHLATLFNNTNTVRKPEQGDQIVHRVFCQPFTKSCQITND